MGTNSNSSTKMSVGGWGKVPEKLLELDPKRRATRNDDNPVSGNHPGTVTLLTSVTSSFYHILTSGREGSKQARATRNNVNVMG